MIAFAMSISLAQASPPSPPSCADVILACDKALSAKDTQIKDLGVVVDLQKSQDSYLTDTVTRQSAELSAWYRNPLIMMLIGGAITAVLVK